MFEKCITCEHLGKDCMPNLCVMSIEEINRWAIKLKAYKRITNAELSERSGVPKGTIDMHFSKKKDRSPDVSYSTFAPVLCALTGCAEMQCQKQKLEGDAKDVAHVISENQRKIDYLKDDVETMKSLARGRMKAIIALGVLLGITLIAIIAALLIDNLNPEIGFIWHDH